MQTIHSMNDDLENEIYTSFPQMEKIFLHFETALEEDLYSVCKNYLDAVEKGFVVCFLFFISVFNVQYKKRLPII